MDGEEEEGGMRLAIVSEIRFRWSVVLSMNDPVKFG